MKTIAKQAQPFLFQGSGSAALLFIHGFTASPSEVAPTARIIRESGHITVQGVLLPGHGTEPGDLNRTGWPDWFRAVEENCQALMREYQRVYLAGLSMGGLLALYAGAQIPGLQGIITINAPLLIRNFRKLQLTTLLRRWKMYWPKDGDDQELQVLGRFAYNCYPLQAMSSMLALRRKTIKVLGDLKLPLLIIQSGQDESVLAESSHYIARQCRQARARILELPRSRHVATMGEEKELIARETLNFIRNHF